MRYISDVIGAAMLSMIVGCAPVSPSGLQVKAASGRAGTILSMRTVDRSTPVETIRAALLTDGTGRADDNRPLVEFIVRADDGATLSIVQTNASGFHQGDRVVILHDDQTRLARPG